MVQTKKYMHMLLKKMEKHIYQYQKWQTYMMLKFKIFQKQKLLLWIL